MFQSLCRSNSSTSRMPVSLSEWRVRIGTYVPRMLQLHNLVRYLKQLLFLALLETLADGQSNGDPSEKQETGSTPDHQSSTDKTSSKPEKDDSCDEQETASSDNIKDIPHKASKKRKRRSQKGTVSGLSSGAFMSFRCFMKSGASPLLRFMLLVFTAILLVRSGDVEVNPGPNENTVPDGILLDIAKRIPQDKMYDLGAKLGVNLSALRRYHESNTMSGTVNCNGTTNMLVDWRDNASIEKQKDILRNALNASSLQAVAEEYLPQDSTSESVMAARQKSSLEIPNIATIPTQSQPMDYSNQQPYPNHVHYQPSHNTASHQYAARASFSQDPLPSRYQGMHYPRMTPIPAEPLGFGTRVGFTPSYLVGPQGSQFQNKSLQPNHPSYGQVPPQQERMHNISSHINVQGSTCISTSNLPHEFPALNLSRTPLIKPTSQQTVSYSLSPEQPHSAMWAGQLQIRTQSETASPTLLQDHNAQRLSGYQTHLPLKKRNISRGPVQPIRPTMNSTFSSNAYLTMPSTSGHTRAPQNPSLPSLSCTHSASRANPSPGPSNLKRTASGKPVQPVQDTMDSTSSSNASPTMPSTSGHTSTYASQNLSLPPTHCTDPITEAQLKECIGDIQEYYRVYLCQISTSPLDSDSIVELQSIFTNLSLVKEDRYRQKKIPLKYEDLLTVHINGKPARCIMIQGEAGVGKTTFCAKIAWDWVTGDHYQDYTFVAVVPLRDANNGKTVGQVLKTYLPDDNDVTSEQLDEYIRRNQKKVLTVFDGFDEFSVEMSNEENQIVQIIKGKRQTSGRVIITTRPWRALEITDVIEVTKQFAHVNIEGFKKRDVKTYVNKFYNNDTTSATALLEYMEEGSLIAETMAPFPIFCSMLCHLWKEVERRYLICKLQTFSQLFQEMIVLLKQHYVSKHTDEVASDNVEKIGKRINGHLKNISEVAFNGLLDQKLVFSEDSFHSCVNDLRVACEVGILTKERTTRKRDESVRKLAKLESTVAFPHKLFQEYIAGLYLQDLFNSNKVEFNNQMKSRILQKPGEFRYLLYFVGSLDECIAEHIVRKLMARKTNKLNFIVEVALECQSEEIAKLIEAEHPEINQSLTIKKGSRAHVIAGYIFTFKHLVSLNIETFCSSKALCRIIADTVCSVATLKELKIGKCTLADEFIKSMQQRAENVVVESLDVDAGDMSASSLQNLAASLRAMSCLKNIKLSGNLPDEFCSALREGALSLKVESLDIDADGMSASSSENLVACMCVMPCLKNLKSSGNLSDEFCSALTEGASSLKVESLDIVSDRMSASSSENLVASMCVMPCLKNLKLSGNLSDEFCSALAEGASSLKVESLELEVEHISADGLRSLGASICSMPRIRSVNLVDLSYGMYNTRKSKITLRKNVGGSSSSEVISSSCQINLKLKKGELIIAFVSSLSSSQTSSAQVESLDIVSDRMSASSSENLVASMCVMPCLKNLKLPGNLSDEFCSALAEGASSLKVESLELEAVHINEDGLRSLGASICSMPCIRSVNLVDLSYVYGMYKTRKSKITLRKNVGESSSSEVISSSCQINLELTGERIIAFVSSISSSQTPSIQVESLQIDKLEISETASQTLGACICAMTYLKDVKLSGKLSDGFYNVLREGASSLKVESLQINDNYISESASQTLGSSICGMQHLKDVKLRGNLSNGFYNDFREGASSLKIRQMHLMRAYLDSFHLSTLALMPDLKSLTLYDIIINSRNHTEMDGSDEPFIHSSTSLTELNVDHDSFISLHRIGILKRFPCIEKMTLAFHYGQTPYPQELLDHHVTMPSVIDLSLHGYWDGIYIGASLAMLSLEPFPNLKNISLINIYFGNDKCTTILNSLRNNETLKTISIKDCNTDAGLDPLVDEINAEGKMMVTVEHGAPNWKTELEDIFKKL